MNTKDDMASSGVKARSDGSYEVGLASDIPPGSRRIVRLGDRWVGVFNIEGDFFAVRNVCPHQGGPICEGTLTGTTRAVDVDDDAPIPVFERDGEFIRCPWHAWEFDIRTGLAVFGSGVRVRLYSAYIDYEYMPPPAEVYPASVDHGVLVVDVGVEARSELTA